MTPLQKNALGTTPLSAGATQMIYSNARLRESVVSFKTLERLCLSHERLRAELAEAEGIIQGLVSGKSMTLTGTMFLSRHAGDHANKRKDGAE